MQTTKGDLIRLGAEILTNCPMSTYLEDVKLPCKLGIKNSRHLQSELYKLDSWLKSLTIKLKKIADGMYNSEMCICEHRDKWIKGMLSTPTECSEETAFQTLDKKFNQDESEHKTNEHNVDLIDKLNNALFCLNRGEQTRPQRIISEVISQLRQKN